MTWLSTTRMSTGKLEQSHYGSYFPAPAPATSVTVGTVLVPTLVLKLEVTDPAGTATVRMLNGYVRRGTRMPIPMPLDLVQLTERCHGKC